MNQTPEPEKRISWVKKLPEYLCQNGQNGPNKTNRIADGDVAIDIAFRQKLLFECPL